MRKLLIALVVLIALAMMPMAVSAANNVTTYIQGTIPFAINLSESFTVTPDNVTFESLTVGTHQTENLRLHYTVNQPNYMVDYITVHDPVNDGYMKNIDVSGETLHNRLYGRYADPEETTFLYTEQIYATYGWYILDDVEAVWDDTEDHLFEVDLKDWSAQIEITAGDAPGHYETQLIFICSSEIIPQ